MEGIHVTLEFHIEDGSSPQDFRSGAELIKCLEKRLVLLAKLLDVGFMLRNELLTLCDEPARNAIGSRCESADLVTRLKSHLSDFSNVKATLDWT